MLNFKLQDGTHGTHTSLMPCYVIFTSERIAHRVEVMLSVYLRDVTTYYAVTVSFHTAFSAVFIFSCWRLLVSSAVGAMDELKI